MAATVVGPAAAGRLAATHRIDELVRRCHGGLDLAGFTAEVLRRLPEVVPAEAVFFAAVDPVTLLPTSAVAQDPLGANTARFLDDEYGRDDVNKFADLARESEPVRSLDQATCGDRAASARYREIMAPLGLGDELRAMLIAGHTCWGELCLHLAEPRPASPTATWPWSRRSRRTWPRACAGQSSSTSPPRSRPASPACSS